MATPTRAAPAVAAWDPAERIWSFELGYEFERSLFSKESYCLDVHIGNKKGNVKECKLQDAGKRTILSKQQMIWEIEVNQNDFWRGRSIEDLRGVNFTFVVKKQSDNRESYVATVEADKFLKFGKGAKLDVRGKLFVNKGAICSRYWSLEELEKYVGLRVIAPNNCKRPEETEKQVDEKIKRHFPNWNGTIEVLIGVEDWEEKVIEEYDESLIRDCFLGKTEQKCCYTVVLMPGDLPDVSDAKDLPVSFFGYDGNVGQCYLEMNREKRQNVCEWLDSDLEKWARKYSLGKIAPWKLRDAITAENPLRNVSLLLEHSGIEVSVRIEKQLEKKMKKKYVRNRNEAVKTMADEWLACLWKEWNLGDEYKDYAPNITLQLQGSVEF